MWAEAARGISVAHLHAAWLRLIKGVRWLHGPLP